VFNVGAKLVESCKQQPDLIPEVFGALKKLLQHKDGCIVSYGCRLVLELWDETMDIVQEILPLMTSASSEVRGLAREILMKGCQKQPDLVREVFPAARRFLQHDDDHIVENGCRMVLELCDENTDIIEEVLPLMKSASLGVRGVAREILLKMCTKQPDLVPEVVGALKKLLQHDDDEIVENSCKVVLELCDETMDIVQEVLPLMESASLGVRGVACEILLKMCTKQPDSVPEVFAAARKLLQHEDDSIVEHGCTVIFELCDETMDIIEEVIPLMDSESSGVRRLAKKIFSRVRLNNLIRAFVHQRIPLKYLPVILLPSHGYRAIVFVVFLILYILIF
jgi:hypothetical protein